MKRILISTCLLLSTYFTFAQGNDEILPACVIVNGAVNLTDITQKNYTYSTKANLGYNAGAMFRTNGDFYLLAGLQYIRVNPSVTNTNTGESEKIGMSYFQVPLMGGLQIVKSKDLSKCFHAQLGGSFTTLLDITDNDFGVEESDFRKTGFTVKAGIGADLWIFVADLNYNLLLTKVYEDPGYNNKAKLMCWEFSIGVKINLKHSND